MGVYGDNKHSLWFVINLKSGQKLSKREAAIGQSLEKPNNDLTVDVHRVPYTIKLDQDSAQIKVRSNIRFCKMCRAFQMSAELITEASLKKLLYVFSMVAYSDTRVRQ